MANKLIGEFIEAPKVKKVKNYTNIYEAEGFNSFLRKDTQRFESKDSSSVEGNIYVRREQPTDFSARTTEDIAKLEDLNKLRKSYEELRLFIERSFVNN